MSDLRDFKINTPQYYFYKDMHKHQTLEFVVQMKGKYSVLNNKKMTIKQALALMDTFIDPSDPDVDTHNSIHAYQTAERIRKKYPENKELQIIGLIHDLGKVLFEFGEPNWAIVGDTYVVGCQFPESIVYYDTLKDNVDYGKFDKLGIYDYGCGLDKLNITFGHDEYLYQVLKQNSNHSISERYMNIIRFHSFYPWHTGSDYYHFMNENDRTILKDVLLFNDFDLYSKEDTEIVTPEMKEYYGQILDEYFNGELNW
tara:strand:- start:2527 stop:3294 length:768 start_codon:yes stop_codon:yes gene_type:complete